MVVESNVVYLPIWGLKMRETLREPLVIIGLESQKICFMDRVDITQRPQIFTPVIYQMRSLFHVLCHSAECMPQISVLFIHLNFGFCEVKLVSLES